VLQPLSRECLDPTWVSQYLNRGPTAPRIILAASAVGPVSSRTHALIARAYTRVVHVGYARDIYRLLILIGVYDLRERICDIAGTYVALTPKCASLILTPREKDRVHSDESLT